MHAQLHPPARLLPALSALHQRELHLFQASFSSPGPRRLSSIQLLLIHILRCLLPPSLLFFSLAQKNTWNIIEERRLYVPSFSVLPRLHSKDKVFLGFPEPSLKRHFLFSLLSLILPYTGEPLQTASLYVYCSTAHICPRDYVSVCMRGEGEWRVTVAAWGESAFCSRRFSLQTQPNCWGLQYGSNLRRAPSLRWQKKTVVCSCMEWQWHSNSSHGRDYLTFLGPGGSNATYFLKWSKNYKLIHQRCSAQSLAFWQFLCFFYAPLITHS